MVYFPQLDRPNLYKTTAVVKRVLYKNPHFTSMRQKEEIREAVLKIKPNAPSEGIFRTLRKLRETGAWKCTDREEDIQLLENEYKNVFQ